MKKELKRQIKEDEFASGLETTWQWLYQHREQARIAGIVAVVALAGVLAFTWFRASRDQESRTALGEALETFHANVAPAPAEGAPAPPEPTFTTRQAKYSKALEQFDGVASRYGSLPAGRQAVYYAALCRLELGQLEPAQKVLAELATRSDRTLADRARLSLAETQARAGQLDQALASFRALADDAQALVPRDYVLMSLASALENARRTPEATEAYERVAQEYPDSVFASEARRRADYLKGTSS